MKTTNSLLAIGFVIDMLMGFTAASPVKIESKIAVVVSTVPTPSSTSQPPFCEQRENGQVTCTTYVPLTATSLASVVVPVTTDAPSTTTPLSSPVPSLANFFGDAGAIFRKSKTCVLWGPDSCYCGTVGSDSDMFNSVVINDTTRACPEAVISTEWEGHIINTYAPGGSLWHYYAIDQPGTPMTFGPFITCPDEESCKPIRPLEPAPPEPTRWATCSVTWHILWQQQYQICGGGPWPEGVLGVDGELVDKIGGCGLAPTKKAWRDRWPQPEDPAEWCFSLNHMLGAKNCIGNVLDWDYHVNKSSCWGPG